VIDKIFIPTVKRVENQITYNNLPDELKKRVVFVVQAWERDQYKYDTEYLVLPDTEEYNVSNRYCLTNTKRLIYEEGKNIKYALLDDDLKFGRRNAKYFGDAVNMERSKRYATNDDVIQMFDLYDTWLDEVTVCGCGFVDRPPRNERYRDNASLSSALWINGSHFSHILKDLDLTCVGVAQDVLFLLTLLTRGFANRVSEEYIFFNASTIQKTMKSPQWDKMKAEEVQKDHEILEKQFPGIFQILRDESGSRIHGGFRNHGKSKINWNKAFKQSQLTTLKNLLVE